MYKKIENLGYKIWYSKNGSVKAIKNGSIITAESIENLYDLLFNTD